MSASLVWPLNRFCRAFLAAALLAACAKESGDLPEQGLKFWTVPELPAGASLEVNGRAVDAEVLRGFLLPPWTERWDGRSTPEEASRALFADPRALFEPLVHDVLLLQEAELRWPTLEKELVFAADSEMARATGSIRLALLERLGEAGLRAHVERELRKRLLLESFGAEAEPVTDDEVYERYAAQMADEGDPALLAQHGVNYEGSAPGIRVALERLRAVEVQEQWVKERLPKARVRAIVPGGAAISW